MIQAGQELRRVTQRSIKASGPAGLPELERELDARSRLEAAVGDALAEVGARSN